MRATPSSPICRARSITTPPSSWEQIDGQIAGSMPAQLVLDFGGVDFMDSSGVGLILGRAKQMQALEGRITVQKVPPAVAKMLRLARIESI